MKKMLLYFVLIALIVSSTACSSVSKNSHPSESSVPLTTRPSKNETINIPEDDITEERITEDNGEDLKNEDSNNAPPQIEVTTGESAGVPHSQIEEDLYPREVAYAAEATYSVDECNHDIDPLTHRDVVTVKYRRIEKYLTTHFLDSAIYQYDRTTDTWTVIPNSFQRSFEYELPETLVGETFQGETKVLFDSLWYTVTVTAINSIEGWLVLSYNITYAGQEYNGETYIEYGNFSSPRIEQGMFKINFEAEEGITVYGS